MKSQLFTLDFKDLKRALVTAVTSGFGLAILTGALIAIQPIISVPGFDLYQANLTTLWHVAVNGAFGGFFGYLIKRYISDSNGRTFGSSSL